MNQIEKVKINNLEDEVLEKEIVRFLNLFGQESILGEKFISLIGQGNGVNFLMLKEIQYILEIF